MPSIENSSSIPPQNFVREGLLQKAVVRQRQAMASDPNFELRVRRVSAFFEANLSPEEKSRRTAVLEVKEGLRNEGLTSKQLGGLMRSGDVLAREWRHYLSRIEQPPAISSKREVNDKALERYQTFLITQQGIKNSLLAYNPLGAVDTPPVSDIKQLDTMIEATARRAFRLPGRHWKTKVT